MVECFLVFFLYLGGKRRRKRIKGGKESEKGQRRWEGVKIDGEDKEKKIEEEGGREKEEEGKEKYLRMFYINFRGDIDVILCCQLDIYVEVFVSVLWILQEEYFIDWGWSQYWECVFRFVVYDLFI